MKKFLIILFTALLMCFSLTYVYAADVVKSGECGENATFTLDKDGVLIISGEGEIYDFDEMRTRIPWEGSTSVGVKSLIVNEGITSIPDNLFSSCKLTSVVLSDTVTNIGNKAFMSNTKLTSLVLPKNLKTIGDSAFQGCSSLTSITLPDTLTHIGQSAFLSCTSLTSISLPDGITVINNETFYNCNNLKEIKLPNKLTKIDTRAFGFCYSVEEIAFPKSLKEVSVDAFVGAVMLTKVHITDLEAWWNIIFHSTFSNPLYGGGDIYLNNEPITTLVIPDKYTHISNSYLSNLKSVESIIFHKGVKEVKYSAFQYSENLKTVTFLSSETKIIESSEHTPSPLAFPETVAICAPKGSIAEQYALKNGFKFSLLKNSLANFQKSNTYAVNQFKDSTERDWYYDNVKAAYEYSIMLGTSSDKFSPSDNLTLAQVVTLAARLNSIYKDGEAKFVQGDVWYQVYIDYCIENGILTKDAYSDFNKSATRADFVSIISKAIPSEEFNVINSFDAIYDVPSTHKNFNEIISFYRSGILVGSDEMRSFKPDSNITRAETATIITRIIDKTLRVKIQ